MSRKNDMGRFVDDLAAFTGPSREYTGTQVPSAQRAAGRSLIRRSIKFATTAVLANGSGAIVPNATMTHRAEANIRILQAFFTPQVAATEHASNNAQISVKDLYPNGWVNRTVATQSTAPVVNGGTGSLVVGVAVALTPNTTSNTTNRIAKGVSFGPALAMNSSGVAMGAGTIQVDYELEDPIDEVGV